MKRYFQIDLPLRTVLIYLVFGFLWILFSDGALAFFVRDLEVYQGLQTYKGWFFIVITGLALYPVIAPRYYQLKKISKELLSKNAHLEAAISEVQDQQAYIEEIYNASNTAIVVWNFDCRAVQINKRFTTVFGYDHTIFALDNWAKAMGAYTMLEDVMARLKAGAKTLQKISRMQTKSGEERIIDWNHQLIRDPHNHQPLIVSFGLDKTLEIKQEEHIYRLGYYDKWTQLGNIYKFEMDLDSILKMQQPFYLIAFQVEELSRLTSIYGPKFGDLLLLHFSENLKVHIDESSLYKWQSNSFVARCHDMCHEELNGKLLALEAQMPSVMRIQEIDVKFHYAVGIVQYPDNGETDTELIQNLHFALKKASDQGKRSMVIFDPTVKRDAEFQLEIEEQLELAIENDALDLAFQPIVGFDQREVKQVEVLLRWPSPKYCPASIGTVIALAEKNGQVFKIDRYVIDKVFRLYRENKKRFQGLHFSINLSAQSFNSEDLLPFLESMIETYKIPPNQFSFELTEHSIIDQPAKSLITMAAIKAMGFTLSLDDFGTMYSSLNYLRIMPFDRLKIDKSYIDGITHESSQFIITDEIIRLAKRLGLETVAEGVETEDQALRLHELGCDLYQGYYYFKPMSLDALIKVL